MSTPEDRCEICGAGLDGQELSRISVIRFQHLLCDRCHCACLHYQNKGVDARRITVAIDKVVKDRDDLAERAGTASANGAHPYTDRMYIEVTHAKFQVPILVNLAHVRTVRGVANGCQLSMWPANHDRERVLQVAESYDVVKTRIAGAQL